MKRSVLWSVGAAILCLASGQAQNSNAVAIERWYSANLTATFAVGSQPTGIVFDGLHIWVANDSSGTVTKLQANDGTVLGTFSAGTYPHGLAFDGVNIWVPNYGFNGAGNTVTVLNASTGQPTSFSPVTVGSGPWDAMFDGAYIWITNTISNNVSQLNAADGSLVKTCPISSQPFFVAFDGVNVWVTDSTGLTELRASNCNVLRTSR